MKKVFNLAAAVMAAFLFASCASIPEPSEKNQTMVYGTVEYNGSYEYAGSNSYEKTTKLSGIKLTLRNINTHKTYSTTSNTKGEFIKTNIPEGRYSIKELHCEFQYDERTWWTTVSPQKNDRGAQFNVKNGVTNIGHIRINTNYTTNKVSTWWGENTDSVRMNFRKNYPESAWNDEPWQTMDGHDQD